MGPAAIVDARAPHLGDFLITVSRVSRGRDSHEGLVILLSLSSTRARDGVLASRCREMPFMTAQVEDVLLSFLLLSG
jgi:hypothetical protein